MGDTFRITVLDKTFIYEVDQIKTVLPDDVSDLLIDEEKEFCTLVTCTPYGINTNTKPETPAGNHPQTGDTTNMTLYVLLMAASGLALLVVGIVLRKKSRAK